MIFSKPIDTLKQLNAIRTITYIKKALECIEIGNDYDRTKINNIISEIKNKINKFLCYIKDRRGISGFKLTNINIEIEEILVDICINFEDYDDFYMIISIPYTSTNYGLK